jgi:hypothetical protein
MLSDASPDLPKVKVPDPKWDFYPKEESDLRFSVPSVEQAMENGSVVVA